MIALILEYCDALFKNRSEIFPGYRGIPHYSILGNALEKCRSRRPLRSFFSPRASPARIFSIEQPARISVSTCRSRFLSTYSLTEPRHSRIASSTSPPWLVQEKDSFLPGKLNPEFPALFRNTSKGDFQPGPEGGLFPATPLPEWSALQNDWPISAWLETWRPTVRRCWLC